MSKFNTLAARFARDERGATMIEYSILLAIITAATVGIVVAVGGKVTTAWTTLNGAWVP
jgi:pilus assembly protein Flp/PilA